MDDILSRTAASRRPRAAYLAWAAVALAACQPAAPAPATAPPTAPPTAPAAAAAPASTSAPAAAPAAAPAPATAPVSSPAPSPAPPPAARVHLLRRRGPLGGAYDYLVVEPAGAGPEAPLVVALHGRGSRPERFAQVAEALRLPFRTIVPRAPLLFPAIGDLRQWFRGGEGVPAQVDAQVKRLVRFLGELRAAYPEAPRPLVFGFSQGAMLTLELVARHPEQVRAAAVLSGSFPTAPPQSPSRSSVGPAATSVPVLLTVGAKDVVVAPADTLAAAARLRALGHAPELFHFAGGHQLPRSVLKRLRAFLWRHGHPGVTRPRAAQPGRTRTRR